MRKLAVLALVVLVAGCGQAPLSTELGQGKATAASAASKANAFAGLTSVSVTSTGRTGNGYVEIIQLKAEGPNLEVEAVFHYVPLLDEPGSEPSAAIDRVVSVTANGKSLSSAEGEALGEALMKLSPKAGARKDLVHKFGWFLAM